MTANDARDKWEYGYSDDYDSAEYWRRQRRGKRGDWHYEYFSQQQIVSALQDHNAAAQRDEAIRVLEMAEAVTLDIIARETGFPQHQLSANDVLIFMRGGATEALARLRQDVAATGERQDAQEGP